MITILKARQNNLKAINLNIPDNRIIVVTGVSGSGKSSLVYDIIFNEGRKRYLESFSSSARQFLGKLNQADVEYIMGLSPAIALEQKSIVKSPHSTVGTLSEIYDLLRLMFARLGDVSHLKSTLKVDKNLFSFNNSKGACEACKGLGVEEHIDENLLIGDVSKTIREGCFKMTTPNAYIVYSQVTMEVLNEVCKAEGFTIDIPWHKLSKKQQHVVLYGSKKIKVPFGKHTLESRMKWRGITAKPRDEDFYKGIIPVMEEILRRDRNPNVLRFSRSQSCQQCKGSRLNDAALSVKITNKNIHEFNLLTIDALVKRLNNEAFFKTGVAKTIADEILKTAQLIIKLGLGFLNLNRPAHTLSGGETQRLRLVKHVASGLRGILYVFDEPSVGLHPQDAQQLMELFWTLREQGNTILLVEHNTQIIKQCDWIIDLGPAAGANGGYVLYNGAVSKFLQEPNPGNSKTHQYLHEANAFKKVQNHDKNWFSVEGASGNTLKNIRVDFKLQALNVVCGVSGAGKTTLVDYAVAEALRSVTEKTKSNALPYKNMHGHEAINKVVVLDQSAIGKTPRSNPATYIGLADDLRNLFAKQALANELSLSKSHFSFNTKGGRCDECEGAGYLQMGMQMLGSVEVLCTVCNGKQFKPEPLKVKIKNKSLADIYALTVDEALEFFNDEALIMHQLSVLQKLGLGYLQLNQRSSTLSGGEARRIKLAKALIKPNKQHTLYIIDEPSSGLHPYDVSVLLSNLQQLVNNGHTVILVEHQALFISQADHLIELGPGSGAKGGEVVYMGKPEGILRHKTSATAKALRKEVFIENTASIPRVINQKPIDLQGVETHNLKKITAQIPFNKLTVVTGVSGSGKSSLVFDTLFNEGRQAYAENFSSYVRNRLNINSQAKYESINGLLPTIAVNQQSIPTNDRSTVGTVTGIYDKIRLLFSRIAQHPEDKPRLLASYFSFNNEQGACKTCQGLGTTLHCDVDKLITHPEKAIINGAMQGHKTGQFYGDVHGQYVATLKAVGERFTIDFSQAWNALSAEEQNIALYGTQDEKYTVAWEFKRNTRQGRHEFSGEWKGFLALVNEEYARKAMDKRAQALLPFMKKQKCLSCKGNRLNNEALQYKMLDYNIADFSNATVLQLLDMLRKWVVWPDKICNNALDKKAFQILLGQIINGLDLLNQLGLGYLTLARNSNTLSGGEGQRVRLASCISMELKGVCFILDEPTTGLHPRDTDNLMHMIKELLVQGNTVVVSEHDPEFISKADYILDLGPKAGALGGLIVARGTVDEIKENKASLTGKYLQNTSYTLRKKKPLSGKGIYIKRAHANNLKQVDVTIPTGGLVTIMGVSGSGKSSLLHDVVYATAKHNKPIFCDEISGLEAFDQVVYTQQKVSKVGGNSSVMSFINLHHEIANVFYKVAKNKGLAFTKSWFLPHSKQGKCSLCKGKAFVTTALDFLSDVTEVCSACHGSGFNHEVLTIAANDWYINDILQCTIGELDTWHKSETIAQIVLLAKQLGVDYLKLGQNMSSLSGGEVQRLRILNALLQAKNLPTLFLMDEPTTGLHMHDVELLVKAFDLLIAQGHSLVVIEHHLALIQSADVLIEMGPEAGELGGKVVDIINQ